MKKLEVSIIIPSVKKIEDCNIIRSFTESDVTGILRPQFIFLSNPRIVDHDRQTEILSFESYDLIFVSNDRYIGTCEDNIFRAQDLTDIVKSRVFWIGDHDFIEWNVLCQAIEFSNKNEIDVLGWNVFYSELQENGSNSALVSIPFIDKPTTSNQFIKTMFAGHAIESSIGFSAMMSSYGPVDWAAFIGSHLYSRESYRRIMAYKFREPIYSHVFKQILFAVDYPAKYAFFSAPVIIRFSDTFVKAQAGIVSLGALDRRAMGNSPSVGFGCVMHLYEIQNDALFNLLVNSLCLALVPTKTGALEYQRNSMFRHITGFAVDSIKYKLTAKSHYIEDLNTGSLQDLWFLKLFLYRLVAAIAAAPEVYEGFDKTLESLLAEAADFLSAYFYSMRGNDELLKAALERIARADLALEPEAIVASNESSFSQFLRSRRPDQSMSARGRRLF